MSILAVKSAFMNVLPNKRNNCVLSVLDDETFIVMDDEQIDDIPTMNCNCGKLTMVGDPVTWKKSGRMFGFWGQFQNTWASI